MPSRITLASIVVIRDGKRVRPELNKPFDYTKEEITSILEGHPAALRKPINEGGTSKDDGEAPATTPLAKTGDKAPATTPPAKDDDL